jgi:hypothetical protein
LQGIQQIGQPDGTFGVVALTISYRMGDHLTLSRIRSLRAAIAAAAVVLARRRAIRYRHTASPQNQAAQQGGQHPSTHHFFFGSGLASGW